MKRSFECSISHEGTVRVGYGFLYHFQLKFLPYTTWDLKAYCTTHQWNMEFAVEYGICTLPYSTAEEWNMEKSIQHYEVLPERRYFPYIIAANCESECASQFVCYIVTSLSHSLASSRKVNLFSLKMV